MENNREAFLNHLDILSDLRVEKDTIGLAIIKNPFEELTAYLHDNYCRCGEDNYYECSYNYNWETDVEDLLEKMETLLKGDVPVDVPVAASRKRKIQIED